MRICNVQRYLTLNPLKPGSGRGWLSRGRAPSPPPPKKSMKELCRTPSCYRGCTSIEMELTCKKFGKNLKNWVRFWNVKIWQHWYFASTPVTKIHVNRSTFKIEGPSFGFSLIFVCSKNHILQLKVSDRFFNDLIFYTPLPKGGYD